jgi:hypothetical protein
MKKWHTLTINIKKVRLNTLILFIFMCRTGLPNKKTFTTLYGCVAFGR